jgi:hypothetical protein
LSETNSIQAWREARLQTYPLDFGGEIKYMPGDVLAMLGDGEDTNPLMAIIAQHTDPNPKKAAESAVKNITPEELIGISTALNAIMIKIVHWPPLIEQGHEEGVSVNELGITEKMNIFMELAGGQERLDAASGFHDLPPGGLVALPEQSDVRGTPVEAVESDV